jgi:hypothetical protein
MPGQHISRGAHGGDPRRIASARDPSGHGEGERFLGFTTVTTDTAGNASFVVSLSVSAPARQFITATATDPGNNTSEFWKAVRVAAVKGPAPARSTGTAAPILVSLAEPSKPARRVADVRWPDR